MSAQPSLMARSAPVLLLMIIGVFYLLYPPPPALSDEQATYLGAQACQECHEEQFARFSKSSKKAHSFNSIKIMRKGLTEEEVRKCYECHTTGYNKPGGFRSEGETPHLMNAGCEVCHGPGSLHAASQDTKQITRRPKLKDCEVCHNAERVGAFRFKPMIYGGAH